MKKNWTVFLGATEWVSFTYPRAEGSGFRLLGSIRRGPQRGALAIDEQGRYVQLNGDYVTELNQSQVAAAVRRASSSATRPSAPRARAHEAPSLAPPKAPAKPPVIVVRRRRVLEVT
jgi:hypothetical protein